MNKQMTSRNLIKKFSKYFRPYIAWEISLILLLIISSIGSLATPYALKIIIDDIFPHGNLDDLVVLLSVLVGIYIIRIVSTIFSDIIQVKISQKIVSDIRHDMLHNLFNRPVNFYKHVNSGEILYIFMNDVQNIQNALSSLIILLLNDGLTLIGIVVMLGILNLKLTLISLLCLPVILYSLKKFTPLLQASFMKVQHMEEKLNVFFIERIKNIRVIKSFNTLFYELQKLSKIQSGLLGAYLTSVKVSSLNSNIITFFVAIGPIIVLIMGGKDVFKGAMTIGALIAFIQYLNRLYAPTINIMKSYDQLTKALVSMERVIEYIGVEQKTIEAGKVEANSLEKLETLTLNNLSLNFEGKKVLENVDMTFEIGKIYGIIGPSGSGKSSIINLLCGFLEPNEGEIVVNQTVKIKEIRDWTSHVGLIEKENQLFSGNILENLLYGNFSASREDIDFAIECGRFKGVLEDLELGENTLINDNGSILSDGQKQRISIVRALLKRPSLIIFDEATSSLDSKLEMEIIEKLKLYYKDSIIIIITHRLSSVKSFDHVYDISKELYIN
ncbi:ABC transporter ATP-binding protein [Pedobacter cryoconitis]|uniref:ABC transporter ATP-binding protein n=1 Tax=Pedobacter cryoconitis TaxID=188932 RepID=UPI000837D8C3|nr:ABC transporter ATP-binding protein [Pedobacter cryoconitis]